MRLIKHIDYYLFFVFLCDGCAVANSVTLTRDLSTNIIQECTSYISDSSQVDQPIIIYDPDQVMQSFLKYHFNSWEQPFLSFSPEQLYEAQKARYKLFEESGWGINRHPISTELVMEIINNMDLNNFFNCKIQPAILVRATNLRGLPSDNPSFTHPFADGEGYPFDNWQASYLPTNEPVCLVHQTLNKAWYFVVTSSHSYGWIKREDIAYVTPEFIAKWKTGNYITPLLDNLPIQGNSFSPLARIGQLIPLAEVQPNINTYDILTVSVDSKGYATIKNSNISKTGTTPMPLIATLNNMARLANNLMGQPYSWGGLQGYRDCSALTKDLLMPFGIWMPRNSASQAKAGTFISLKNLKKRQKVQLITEQGIPFFSLIWMPGHIVLYIGLKQGNVYVYNGIWGMRTGKTKRAILGKTVIMPIDFGNKYFNIKQSLLEKAEGIVLLNNRLTTPNDTLPLFMHKCN